MKKLVSLLFVLFACAMSYGQDTREVTRFLGIPVDGTRAEMVSKLKEKGFTSVPGTDMLEGEFNGKDSYISVQTNNRKVWRIGVLNKSELDETQIKIDFNNLCSQFESNDKYVGSSQFIPEDEKISYEILVNKKRYEASFFQKSQSDGSADINRLVWFMINEVGYDKYQILMFYENGYNKANGEDL